jgi:mannose-1-phosphate guanylyltransferase
MSSSLTAFFLCAGYGKRLRPLTDRVPKPAIPFLGESALALNVRAVDEALKPDKRIANAHHLPDAIRAVATPLGMDVIFEPEILGTGGCLANAAGVLGATEHFLVHNADLIHDIDLAALWREHVESGALATLAGMHVEGAVNTLSVSVAGALLGVHGFEGFAGDTEESKRLTFAGVAFYRRDFLAFCPSGESDIKPLWKNAQKGGGRIRVKDCSGTSWYDFGTPQGLWEATKHWMEKSGTFAHGYSDALDDKGRPPRVSNEAGLKDLPTGLRNVVIYETPKIPLDPETTNLLTGFDFDWKIRP